MMITLPLWVIPQTAVSRSYYDFRIHFSQIKSIQLVRYFLVNTECVCISEKAAWDQRPGGIGVYYGFGSGFRVEFPGLWVLWSRH